MHRVEAPALISVNSRRRAFGLEGIKKMDDVGRHDVDMNDDRYDELWRIECEKKGRFPYIYIPHRCARCGELWPNMFHDPEWTLVVDPCNRHLFFCHDCYALIKNRFRPGAKTVGTPPEAAEATIFKLKGYPGDIDEKGSR